MMYITDKVVDNKVVEVWMGANGTIYFVKK
jgi:hypothetical protein